MSTTFVISSICYGLVGLISILFGSIYLLKNQFMPYHSEAVGYSWSELEPNVQVLIIALMRATGGGFFATGLAIFILLMIPLRVGNIWASYAISAIAISSSIGTLYATLLVKTKTPGKPPFGLSLLAASLTVIGFIFSLI
jgi:hypothetical protein